MKKSQKIKIAILYTLLILVNSWGLWDYTINNKPKDVQFICLIITFIYFLFRWAQSFKNLEEFLGND